MTNGSQRILFLCTGNYYRSRYAEYLFNHLAGANQLNWLAFSRGLAIELLDADAGPISPHTVARLSRWGIATTGCMRMPKQVSSNDLAEADHIVAVKRTEHLPLMERRFPEWTTRVEFWEVDDVDLSSPDDALPRIESAIEHLIERLR